MEESSPRVDPDIEKVRKTAKLNLTSAFRIFYLQLNRDQSPWKMFFLELYVRYFSVSISCEICRRRSFSKVPKVELNKPWIRILGITT